MSQKKREKSETLETTAPTSHLKKQQGRYSSEKNKKITPKLNETETGPRQSRGKKQRRQFKLAPNRG
jgi:hypothetical protein